MKKISILFIIFIIFFTGCTRQNHATKSLNKNEFFTSAIQYSKKSTVIKDDKITALLNATYLNPTAKKWNIKHRDFFVLGIYIKSGIEVNEEYIKNSFSIQKQKLLKVSLLKDKEMLKGLPLKNGWVEYYVVEFEKSKKISKTNDVKIEYKDNRVGETTLLFLRD